MGMMQNFYDLLKCPDCGGKIAFETEHCSLCFREFHADAFGIINMLSLKKKEIPPIYFDSDYVKWRKMFPSVFESRGSAHRAVDESTHHWTAQMFAHRTLKDKGWVADLGCGVRDISCDSASSVKRIGVDIDRSYLEELSKGTKKRFLVQADIESLPFQDEAIHCCFVLHALEHIYNLRYAVKEIKRVTRAGGYVYVGLPCEGGILRDFLRSVTTAKRNSKRFGIDYEKVCRIEHCQKARDVIDMLKKEFKMVGSHFFPLSLLPSIHINLTVSFEFQKLV